MSNTSNTKEILKQPVTVEFSQYILAVGLKLHRIRKDLKNDNSYRSR